MKTKALLAPSLALGLALAAIPLRAAPADPGWSDQQQTERFSKSVTLGATGSFLLANISGDIVVTGGAGTQIQIEAIKKGRTTTDLQNARIDVTESAGRVEVRVEYPRDTRNAAAVDFTVTVPKGAEVSLKSVSGDIKVSGIDGDLRAETVSGDVTVDASARLDTAKTVSGNVTVQSASSPDTLTAGSVSGDVSLRGVKARSLEAGSVSGEIRLIDVTCERATAKSVSGDLTFEGPLAKGGRYELTSHSGDVVVRTGDTVGFELSANTFSGDINSDLPINMRFGGDEGRRSRRRQEIRGTYGDGSAMLTVTSFSGNIRIVKR